MEGKFPLGLKSVEELKALVSWLRSEGVRSFKLGELEVSMDAPEEETERDAVPRPNGHRLGQHPRMDLGD